MNTVDYGPAQGLKDCKKLTSVRQFDVKRKPAPLGHILGRCGIRKGSKIMDQVSLVEVATGQGDIQPIDLLFPLHQTQHPLESPNAAKPFGGKSDVISKELVKVAGAQPNLLGHCADGILGGSLKLSQRKLNGGMAMLGPHNLEEKLLQGLKPFRGSGVGWC